MAKVQHTCTGCVPIDASIIDVYVTLVQTNQFVTDAETGRALAEAARVTAENARTATFSEDHSRAVTDHTNAQTAINNANAAAAAANAAGITSASASVDSNVGTPSVDVSLVNKQLSLSFHNIKGEKGEKGDRGDGAIPVVNDLVTGGTAAALSAEMGKTLNTTKQATLVSGTNIKTVNGESLLGEGNIVAGDPNAVKYVAQTLTDAQKAQARTNIDAYQKPSTGIPATDLASAAQTSLGKADTAYQKPAGGIPKTDLDSGVQGSLDLADSAIQARPMGEVDPTITPADYATTEELSELEAKVDDKIEGKKTYTKNLVVQGTTQAIALDAFNFGKSVALRVKSNSATSATIQVGIRSNGSSQYYSLSTDWKKFDSQYDIDRVYVYVDSVTVAGTIVVECVFGDYIRVVYPDTTPTQNSKELITSGGVYTALSERDERITENRNLIYGLYKVLSKNDATKTESGYVQYEDGVFVTNLGFKTRVFPVEGVKYIAVHSGTNGTAQAAIAFFSGEDITDSDLYIKSGSVQAVSGIADYSVATVPQNAKVVAIENRVGTLDDSLHTISIYVSDAEIDSDYDRAVKDSINYKEENTWDADSFEDTGLRVLKTIIINGGNCWGYIYMSNSFYYGVRFVYSNGEWAYDSGWKSGAISWDTRAYSNINKVEFVFRSQSGDDVSPADVVAGIKSLTCTYYENVSDSLKELQREIAGVGNTNYYGKEITLPITEKKNLYTLTKIYSEVNGTGNVMRRAQSLAVYNDRAFVVLGNTTTEQPDTNYGVAVFDLSEDTPSLIGKYELPGARSHHNNAQFSDVFFDEDDTYPLLFVSKGDYPGTPNLSDAYFIRVVESEGAFSFTLVKTIHCTLPNAEFGGTWVANFMQKRMWLYCYTKANYQTVEGNNFCMFEFPLPDLTNQQDETFGAANVVRFTKFGYLIAQAATCIGGKIWLQAQDIDTINGLPVTLPQKNVLVIDPDSGEVETVLVSDVFENEGIAEWNGVVYQASKWGNASEPTDECFRILTMRFGD